MAVVVFRNLDWVNRSTFVLLRWAGVCDLNKPYFKDFDKRKGLWTLMFATGIAIGGFISTTYLSSTPIEFLPESFMSIGGAIRLFIGGILIGFGTRYAGGCTSGHAITGIANLNWPSLVATIFFFVGGLGVTWGLGRLIF